MDDLKELIKTRQELQTQLKETQQAIFRTEQAIFDLWAPVGSTWKKVSNPCIRGKVTSHNEGYIRIKHNRSTWAAKITVDELIQNWVPWGGYEVR